MSVFDIRKGLYKRFGIDRRKGHNPGYKGPERRKSMRRKLAVDRILVQLEKETR
ncbi:MAG: hypothetical protein JRF59_12185 [Deltaproteobacteria bacterium]|nr:hypothetical protein [Deltaproteobacteria bacterium]MBW1924348.1 hypothetical protein [Deltaproteobacteria bacterium]MBW1950607.1 hypothetical protein [Deltaproteobacteria bacterium]MBW2009561.1 hypothetical protein [Deltaproteobacteria bacterium]MBW2104308.1 hypothetical protein [Deltaproteobacteria bacterium]